MRHSDKKKEYRAVWGKSGTQEKLYLVYHGSAAVCRDRFAIYWMIL